MKRVKDIITKEKGVYVLFLKSDKNISIRVGCFGTIDIQPWIYAYVGSAFGGGGLRSRLGRHLKTAKKCRWHIDYIRRHMRAKAIWYTTEDAVAEHRIAQKFITGGAGIPMKGFGSSDCKCISHLFHMDSIPRPFLQFSVNIT
jgi:Uri superfamily endonuclease